jgi:hypothetical protein
MAGIISVDTIAALKALSTGTLGTDTSNNTVLVNGYYAAGDGGGGAFKFNSASAAAADDGMVVAPNAGAGRWLRQLLEEEISVQYYGARGDGTTDDTARIQAALNFGSANNINNIFFPPVAQFYRTTASLTVAARMRLHGTGYASAIKMTATSGASPNVTHPNVINITGSFVTIENLRLFGPSIVGGYAPTDLSASAGVAAAGDTLEKITIRSCTIHAMILYGIRLQIAADAMIANNTLYENNGTKSCDIRVTGNVATDKAFDRIKIVENFCNSNSDIGICVGDGNTLARDVLISNNHLHALTAGVATNSANCLRRHAINLSNSGTVATENLENRILVSANHIRFTDATGIYVNDGTSGLPTGPYVINANFIADVGFDSAQPQRGAICLIGNGIGDVVSGNHIENTQDATNGIVITNTNSATNNNKAVLVAGNAISNAQEAISLTGNAHNVHVTNNNVLNSRGVDIKLALNTGSTLDPRVYISANKIYRGNINAQSIFIDVQSSAATVEVDNNYITGSIKTTNSANNCAIYARQARVLVTNNYVKNFFFGFTLEPTLTARETTMSCDFNYFTEIGGTAVNVNRGASTTAVFVAVGNRYATVVTPRGNATFDGRRDGDLFTIYNGAIPTFGTYQTGDRTFNIAPATGQPVGWVFVTGSGWRSTGNLL